MNLLLLHPDDLYSPAHYRIGGRRHQHLITHLKSQVNDTLKAGLINGPLGQAHIIHMTADSTELRFEPGEPPPVKQDITLLLALPRPKMLRRILIDATTLGVKHLILLNSYKVEKSYWSTPFLQPQAQQDIITLALEQAGDTVPPLVQLEKRFKPFVEDRLPALMQHKLCLLAHPGKYPPLPASPVGAVLLAIGPEGGWTDYECDQLMTAGFAPHAFGQRILRVETAVSASVGRLSKL